MSFDIEKAIAVLRESRSVEDAAVSLGVSASRLRRAFRREGQKASAYTLSSFWCGSEKGSVVAEIKPGRLKDPEATRPVQAVRISVPHHLERILICPDVHVPYHDVAAWNTFLAVARGWKPNTLVVLGDFPDFYQVSQYPKDPSRRLQFSDELRIATTELARLRVLPCARRIYCEGNHETRLSRYVAGVAPAMHGVVDVREQLGIDESWEWVPYGHHASVGKLAFTHDVGASGVNAARQSVQAFGGNIIFGHTHRAASHYESTVNGERHAGFTMGWLGDPEAIDYRHRARVLRENQHGFGVAYVESSTGIGWAHFVPIINGRACVDGILYDGRST